MHKKLTRISFVSCGIFFAFMSLIMLIITALIAVFALPYIPMPEGAPRLDFFQNIPTLVQSPEGLKALGGFVAGAMFSGLIAGAVFAILYNLTALFTGGIKVKTRDIDFDY